MAPSTTRKLHFAINGHGFGHATRSIELLRGLLRLCPGLSVTVSTTAPARLFKERLGDLVTIRNRDYEPGTIQRTCFEVDTGATRAAYSRYLMERAARLEEEVRFIEREGFSAVVSDIPALPLEAASMLGIPAAGFWNFTWDWILEPILGEGCAEEGLASVPGMLSCAYATAGLHLRLPFSPRDTPLPHVEDAPLVGRKSVLPRSVTLERLGMDSGDGRPVVLVAVSGWGSDGWRTIDATGCGDFRFLVTGDMPLRSDAEVSRLPVDLGGAFAFCDLVAAADVVLTKPGYGVASECALHRTPLLGVERRGFREAAELVSGLKALGPFREIGLEDFFGGSWGPALRAILEDATPWREVPDDGASRAAGRLVRYFEL